MATTKYITPAALAAALLAGAIGLAPASFALTSSAAVAGQQNSASDVQSKLNKSQFKDVRVTLDQDGIATLTGSVNLYEYKKDAANRIRKAKGVNGVRNQIQVSGKSVSDEELKNKLGEKLTYDRVGYGNAFNSITMSVETVVVTLHSPSR